jgi:hypothetical protein
LLGPSKKLSNIGSESSTCRFKHLDIGYLKEQVPAPLPSPSPSPKVKSPWETTSTHQIYSSIASRRRKRKADRSVKKGVGSESVRFW